MMNYRERRPMNLKYGFSFYPEHCESKEEMLQDVKLIKESGANIIRMGEFCWDQLEPVEGTYNFEILEEAVELLGKEGISTIICTPTSCPPSWLWKKYPEIAYVDYRGFKRPFGSRHSYCYNSPIYRSYTERIVKKIGEIFGNNSNVIGFQIGNEFGQEGSGRCHCAKCEEKFQKYLKDKYVTVEAFNHACGTYFWGLSFTDFSDISLPLSTTEPDCVPHIKAYFDNPGLRLNYERFCSDSIVEYSDLQVELLRNYTDKPITTNSTTFGTNLIDYFDLYKKNDLYALDIYPDLFSGEKDFAELAYSFARSLKRQDFWILEFAVGGGHGLWAGEGRLQPYPGSIPLHVMHAYANGAKLLAHFQYKTFRSGAEQLNYALLDADRVPRRRFKDFQKTVKLLEIYEPILLSTTNKQAQVAIIVDYDVLWALRIKPINRKFDYISYILELHTLLRKMGYSVDVIGKECEFSKYKFVLLPTFFVSDSSTNDRLIKYVEDGGCLFTTFLTSVKDMNNVAYDTGLPGMLKELFGLEVYEVEPVYEASEAIIEINSEKLGIKNLKSTNRHWVDVLHPINATVIGKFGNTWRVGDAIITENSYGSGCAYYCGTALEMKAMAQLLTSIIREQGVDGVKYNVPDGVSVIERCNVNALYLFIFNFSKEKKSVYIDKSCKDVIDGEYFDKDITLEPFSFKCVRVEEN